MSDACSQPKSKHAIDAHVWIGAFAAALMAFGLVWSQSIQSLGGMVGISGLAVQKLNGEVASMRQEIAVLRQSLENGHAAGPGRSARPAPGGLHSDVSELVVKPQR